MTLKILAIIPCYNEAESIGALLTEFEQYALPLDYIVIDDGSVDRTTEIVKSHQCHLLQHERNLGLCMAIRTGLKYAIDNNYDYCIQIDGDGQHPVSEIGKLIEYLEGSKPSMLLGSRYAGRMLTGLHKPRRIAGLLMTLQIWLLFGKFVYDPFSGMRMMDFATANHLYVRINAGTIDAEFLAAILKSSFDVVEIPVQMRTRNSGVSYLSGINGVRFFFKATAKILKIRFS